MAGPFVFDRVKDTSATTGTGTLTLNNTSSTGFRTFGSVLSNSDTAYYAAFDTSGGWETGIGTYTTSGTTWARTVILSSSNSGSAVSFSGTVTVFITPPANCFMDRLPEVSITGAATATIDRWNKCTGTSADYTLSLPAVSGNTGRRLGVRMDSALTKLVTLDGNSSEKINNSLTRVMWADESALLICDGSNWYKIGGMSIPMNCWMWKNGNTGTPTTSTYTKIDMADTVSDNTGRMADATNKKIIIQRPAPYEVNVGVWMDPGGTTLTRLIGAMYKNGSLLFQQDAPLWTTSAYAVAQLPNHVPVLAAADYLELYGLAAYVGGSPAFNGGANDRCHLQVTEQVAW